jgi:PST family polysaccharide transporter
LTLLNKILRSTLFKVSSLNSISVVLKIGIGIVTSKIIAIFIGPSGMALVGNMRNFVSLAENISTLGFQNGIIRFIASHKKDSTATAAFISTIFFVLVGVALLLSLLLFFGAEFWTTYLFGVKSVYGNAIMVFAFTLPWHTLSAFLLAVLNGLGNYQRVIYTNIIGNLLGLGVTVLLVTQMYTLGAMLSLVITPALLFGVTFFYLNKELALFSHIKFKLFDWSLLSHLYSFTVMALFTAIVTPLVLLVLRNYIIDSQGLTQAGFWEAISRISTYYFMFLSTLLTVYFLPKLSMATSDSETKAIFYNYFKSVFPLFIGVLVVIYFLRSFIVQVLFTSEFLPVNDLFLWQIVGDVFKAASVILGYEFFAKKLTKAYLVTETLSFVSLLSLSFLLVPHFQTEGVVMAHAFTYMFYFALLAFYFRKKWY